MFVLEMKLLHIRTIIIIVNILFLAKGVIWLSQALHFFKILIKLPQQKIALEGGAPLCIAKQNIYLQNLVLLGENVTQML